MRWLSQRGHSAGALGCTATHALLVPLDVVRALLWRGRQWWAVVASCARACAHTGAGQVKTKKQSDPRGYAALSLPAAARRVVEQEGWRGLALGAGPTIVGYLWWDCLLLAAGWLSVACFCC